MFLVGVVCGRGAGGQWHTHQVKEGLGSLGKGGGRGCWCMYVQVWCGAGEGSGAAGVAHTW
jgi:hypothetical protein